MARNIKDTAKIALSQKNIGIIHFFTGEMDKARKAYEKALDRYTQINHREGMANLNHNLGLLLKEKGKYEGAIKYYRRSLQFEKEQNDKEGGGHYPE
ncbi:MAG: tetratricopeptide repeat protein [Bacteroidales bacterium]|nr:tetratricopeptide repeat protein [Bacteroidales bacterium]